MKAVFIPPYARGRKQSRSPWPFQANFHNWAALLAHASILVRLSFTGKSYHRLCMFLGEEMEIAGKVERGGITHSLKWRATALARKVTGDIPGITWNYLLRHMLPSRFHPESPCVNVHSTLIAEIDEIEQYATQWGEFWIPKPGKQVLDWLLQEIFIDTDYENSRVAVNPGDVVVDCGGHVGVFARFALGQRAAKVVCIELDGLNFRCLCENLSAQHVQTVVFNTALWSRPTMLRILQASESDCHQVKEESIAGPATTAVPLDELLSPLELKRVDLIKVDVEGAEAEVLKGAQMILRRFRPKLALAVYHDKGEELRVRRVLDEGSLPYHFSYRRLAGENAYILFGTPKG